MKRIQIIGVTLLISLNTVMAQNRPKLLDPDVRYGVLNNGLTYYLLHNEEPKDRASFYIMQNVGAILEEDDQDGLAHMLEHMAFNGSTNFPDKGVKEFLERQGVEFGSNINAYTNTDETVYNISNVPTGKSEVMDSCVLILHDWSGSLTLADAEIDAERGVIKEEWRTRNNANRRLSSSLAPVTYYQSKYAERDVIGEMDVIENSPYSAIRSFYEKWYRTDLQAVVIVGDFDVDEMEERVQTMLSRIPKAKNPAKRKEYPVANNEEVIYSYATDEEAQYVQFSVMIKHDPVKREDKNEEYIREDLKSNLFAQVIGERLSNIQQKPQSPFIGGQIGFFNLTRTKDIYYIGGAKPIHNGLLSSMKALLIENERLRRHGVTESELERAKINITKGYEEAFKNRKEVDNDQKAMNLKDHFLINEPKPGIAFGLEFVKNELPKITVNQVNLLIKKLNKDDNIVVTVRGPKDVDFEYPTQEGIKVLLAEIKQAKMDPFEDKVVTAPLIANEPKPGKILSEKLLNGLDGAKEYTLNNGAKVILYATDKNENQILFRAYSKGGKSLLPDTDLPSADVSSGLASYSGLGAHNLEDLKKIMTGKRAGVKVSIGQFEEGMNGSSIPEDIETLFQMIYMKFEAPRFEQEKLETMQANMKLGLENATSNPKKIMGDSIAVALSGGNLDRRPLNTVSYIERFDFNKCKAIYEDRINNAGDFVFAFVGAIDVESTLPLVEKYIASISDDGRRENWKDDGVRPYSNRYEKVFSREMEVAKQTNFIRYQGEGKYSENNSIVLSIARSILQLRYFNTIREQEGGSYGVSVSGGFSKVPYERYSLEMYFDCNPDKADKLVRIIHEQVQDLLQSGADSDEFSNSIEGLLKSREQSLEQNGTYLNGIINQYRVGVNTALPDNYENILSKMTIKKFNKSLNKIMKNNNTVSVIMRPE